MSTPFTDDVLQLAADLDVDELDTAHPAPLEVRGTQLHIGEVDVSQRGATQVHLREVRAPQTHPLETGAGQVLLTELGHGFHARARHRRPPPTCLGVVTNRRGGFRTCPARADDAGNRAGLPLAARSTSAHRATAVTGILGSRAWAVPSADRAHPEGARVAPYGSTRPTSSPRAEHDAAPPGIGPGPCRSEPAGRAAAVAPRGLRGVGQPRWHRRDALHTPAEAVSARPASGPACATPATAGLH